MGADRDDGRNDIVVHEAGTTIGSGRRTRELKSWEASWLIPLDYRRDGKAAYLTTTSSTSRADAIAKLESVIEQYLQSMD